MKRPLAIAAAVAWAGLAPAARAGEAPCWVDGGVLVVSASVLGIAGDYILDTGQAATELHETRAQGAGFVQTTLSGEVRLAGMVRRAQAVAVADLDARTVALPTPVAGVIGLDVLRDYVLDVTVQPCRVALHRPGRAPRFGRAAVLPLTWRGGRASVPAAISDGPRARRVRLTPATGADAPLRLDDRLARVPGAEKPEAFYPYGRARAELRALSLAGGLYERVPSGLARGKDGSLADGVLGLSAFAGRRLRFDFPRGRLLIAPSK